jgi:two-component system cell cycle sensor histidine kinase/response regulator CckA
MDGEVVLVVDDDALLRDLVGRVIAEAGYRVLLAGDGREALAIASTIQGRLALVVTDVRMPVMDGITLAGHLGGAIPRVPMVFMSGFVPDARDVVLPGPFLAKPFTPDALLLLVQQTLGTQAHA